MKQLQNQLTAISSKILHLPYMIIILCMLALLSLCIGVSPISWNDVIAGNDYAWQILLQVRIPRVMAIILTAFGMSISGLIMQQLSQNKFVSPTTGTTLDGAKLGILLSMLLFGQNLLGKISFAFVFAMLSTSIFIAITQRIKIKNAIFIPLIGLMLGGIIDAVTTFIAYQTDQIQNVNSWLQGSLTSILKGNYELLYLIIPCIIMAFLFANRFTIAGMGETFSVNLGLNYQRVINLGLLIVSIITAIVVIIVGTVPFLGLIIPNIVSIYRGDNIKHSLWETATLGAIFLMICDIIGRVVIFPYEIPISLTVGVIGSAIFLFLILRRNSDAK